MVGSPPPSDTNNQHSTAPAAARATAGEKFLSNLPSRGLFSSTVISSNLGGMRVYVCEHETSPPDDQLIKTDQTNILIRSLMIKKQKTDSSSKEGKGTAAESSRKRSAEITLDGRSKRALNTQSPQQEGSKSRPPQKELQNLTVERLRALLKEKGLSIRGRKDELVARLRAAANE